MSRGLVLLLLLLAGCSSSSRTGAPSFTLESRTYVLPSGMRLIAQRDPRSSHVAVVAVVDAGARTDPPGKEGLAHLVAHLSFRSEAAPGVSMWRMLEQIGAAERGGAVDYEVTRFSQLIHGDLVKIALNMEARRLADPLHGVNESVFEAERAVVVNELADPGEALISGEVYAALNRMLFPADHAYARPLLGTSQSLGSISLADVRAFVQRWYRPENITILVSGHIDLDQLVPIATFALSAPLVGNPARAVTVAMPRISLERVEPPDPQPQKAAEIRAADHQLKAPELRIAWTVPGDLSASGRFEGRVLERLLESTLLYVARTVPDIARPEVIRRSGASAGTLVVRVPLTGDADPTEVANLLLKKLDATLARQSWEDMRSASAGLLFEVEDLSLRADETAQLAHFTGEPTFHAELMSSMEADNRRLYQLVRRYLTRSRARVLTVLPDQPRTSTRSVAETGLGAAEPSDGVASDWVPVPEISRIIAGKPSSELRSFRMENGLEVWIDPWRPGASIFAVLTVFGGFADEALRGEALAAQDVVSSRFSHGIPSAFTCALHRSTLADYENWVVRGPSGNLEEAVEMLSDVARDPIVDNERWYRFNTHGGFPEPDADHLFQRELYQDSTYMSLRTQDEMTALERGDVEARIERLYRPDNAAVMIFGASDVPHAEELVRRLFGDWRASPASRVSPSAPKLATASPRYLLEDAPAQRFELDAGCLVESTFDPAALRALESAVAEEVWGALRAALGHPRPVEVETEAFANGTFRLVLKSDAELAEFPAWFEALHRAFEAWTGSSADPRAVERARFELARDRARAAESGFARAHELSRTVALARGTKPPPTSVPISKEGVDAALSACHRGLVVSLSGPLAVTRPAMPASWTKSPLSD